MTRRMLINAQRADEVRIAIVDGTTLESYQVEAADAGLCRGNIYRAVVAKVQPSLDAAFVDFGADKDGLLRADDVVPAAYHRKPGGDGKHPKIDRILERGQPVLVQVVRDAVGHKGALVTTNLSIAGRYLVLMPLDDVRGVSRKVDDEKDRTVIRERLDRLQLPEGCGVIVRTNAADQPQRSLNRDLNALLRLWSKVRKEANTGKGPRLLYSDQDLIVQALRDSVDSTVDEILVDEADAFSKAEGFMRTFMPRGRVRLVHYTERLPLFSKYELESQIERIYLRKVELPSGGSIVIDGTEALTAIDVNSGRATRGGSQEETAHTTNMEAATEVARQLRMRDIGGLVVVDFIDMRSSKHRGAVEKAMRDAMKDDKAKHTTSRLSPNGLLEINRQRLKKALQLRTHRPCPTCGGAGTIASPELVGLNILRRIETRAVTGRLKSVRVALHPELADAIQNERRKELADLEREFDIRVEIIAATGLHRSEEKIDWTERGAAEVPHPAPQAAVSAADLADGIRSQGRKSESQEAAKVGATDESKGSEGASEKAADQGPEKSPRKRRRGGRKHRKSDQPRPETSEAEPDGGDEEPSEAQSSQSEPDGGNGTKPGRKKRRGGRKRRKKPARTEDGGGAESTGSASSTGPDASDPFSY
ncbi:MAG TPA: Rne/Rng family ribonuclease [Candidatus Sulfomarinibacteraceae bacterium]|nr:Rne/Rng family ribonuclease [Candidatus Sulfomarinibacteraceae bacterium]